MGFQTPQYKLAKLLDWVHDGTIQLPDFQRGYKWDDERIRSLLTTVMLGHPLGVIMVLQTGSDQIRFKPKPLERTNGAVATAEPDHLLLDGQQRLTSLYQALSGDGVVATKDTRGKLFERRYYIDIAKAIGDASERDEAVVSLPVDGIVRTNFNRDIVLDVSTPDKQRAEGYFPLSLVYAQGEGTGWLFAYPDLAVAKTFLDDVLQPMLSYEIPAIELDKSTSKDAVATVFEKVNTGGLPLNVFELLTATFAGDRDYYEQHGTDFRLNDDWQITKAALAQHPVLGGIANTDFLQGVTLLATRERNLASTSARPPAISARKEDVLKLTLEQYLRWADELRDALGWVAMFLADHHIHEPGFVPYRTQIVPLAVLRVVLGENADLHGVRARLSQWYWCGLLGELYGGSVETRFARDVEQVPAWALAAIVPDAAPSTPVTVLDANFVESRLLSLRTRLSAAYRGIYALLMAEGCKDWKYTQSFDQVQYAALAVDIHHVFPRAWCDANGIESDLRESIINKTPLAASTNRYIGAASPASYLPKLEKAAGVTPQQMNDLLRTHEIDPATLRAADFDGFFVARRAALLGLIEKAMGKEAQHDIAAADLTGGDEAPAAFESEPDDLDDVETIAATASGVTTAADDKDG